MESLTVHDLTAAYALDALESAEARDYEAHLAHVRRVPGRARAARGSRLGARVCGRVPRSSRGAPRADHRGRAQRARERRPAAAALDVPAPSRRGGGGMRGDRPRDLGRIALELAERRAQRPRAGDRALAILADPNATRLR